MHPLIAFSTSLYVSSSSRFWERAKIYSITCPDTSDVVVEIFPVLDGVTTLLSMPSEATVRGMSSVVVDIANRLRSVSQQLICSEVRLSPVKREDPRPKRLYSFYPRAICVPRPVENQPSHQSGTASHGMVCRHMQAMAELKHCY